MKVSSNLKIFRCEVLCLWHLQKFSFNLSLAVFILAIRLHRSNNKNLLESLFLHLNFLLCLFFVKILPRNLTVVKWLPGSRCQVCKRISAILIMCSYFWVTIITLRRDRFMVLTVTKLLTWIAFIQVKNRRIAWKLGVQILYRTLLEVF